MHSYDDFLWLSTCDIADAISLKAFWSLILPTIACHTWTPERFLLLKLLCTFGSEAVLNTVCVFLLEWMASCFWIHLLSDPYFGNGGLRRKRLSFTGPMWYDMSAWPLSPKGWKGKTKVNFTKMFFPLWCCGCCFMRFLDMWIPLIIFLRDTIPSLLQGSVSRAGFWVTYTLHLQCTVQLSHAINPPS